MQENSIWEDIKQNFIHNDSMLTKIILTNTFVFLICGIAYVMLYLGKASEALEPFEVSQLHPQNNQHDRNRAAPGDFDAAQEGRRYLNIKNKNEHCNDDGVEAGDAGQLE